MTSPPTTDYTCIAHTAGCDTGWWWPIEYNNGAEWPDGIAREETFVAFAAAYALQGYEPCRDAALEEGFEKVAIYVDSTGEPTHAARQLPSGAWSSKLGSAHDIEHDSLFALEDDRDKAEYGTVALILKRRRP